MEENMMNASKEVIENEVIGGAVEATSETSGKNMVIAMGIGAVLTVATIATGKLAKKLITKIKAKKEAAKAEKNHDNIIEGDFEDIKESEDED